MKKNATIYWILPDSKHFKKYSSYTFKIKEMGEDGNDEKKFLIGIKIESFDKDNRLYVKEEGIDRDFVIYTNGVIVPCLTKRFKEAMEEIGINRDNEDIQFIPITLEKPDGSLVENEYYIMNILNILNGKITKRLFKNKWDRFQDVIFYKQDLEKNNPKTKIFRINSKEGKSRIYVNSELRYLIEKDKRFYTGWVGKPVEIFEKKKFLGLF